MHNPKGYITPALSSTSASRPPPRTRPECAPGSGRHPRPGRGPPPWHPRPGHGPRRPSVLQRAPGAWSAPSPRWRCRAGRGADVGRTTPTVCWANANATLAGLNAISFTGMSASAARWARRQIYLTTPHTVVSLSLFHHTQSATTRSKPLLPDSLNIETTLRHKLPHLNFTTPPNSSSPQPSSADRY